MSDDDFYFIEPSPLTSNGPAITAIIAADPRFELIAGTLFFTDGDRRLCLEVGAWDVTDDPHYEREGYTERAAQLEARYPAIRSVRIPAPAERIEPRTLIDGGDWYDDPFEREVMPPRPPRRSFVDRLLGRS